MRVNFAEVEGVGTYGVANSGNIVVETPGGITVANIEKDLSVTQLGIYSIPASKSMCITRVGVAVATNKTAIVRLLKRENANNVSVPPFSAAKEVFALDDIEGSYVTKYDSWIFINPCSDIYFESIASATAGVDVEIDYILVNQ